MTEILVTFLAISWNVGTTNDWQNLLARSKIETKFSQEIMQDTQKKSAYLGALTEIKNDLNIAHSVIPDHNEKVEIHLNQMIQLNPAVFLLQEFFYADKGTRYKTIFDVLTSNGYTIVMNLDTNGDNADGLAIAYKQDAFDEVSIKARNLEIAVDLKDKKSGLIVRFVSAHLKGFDAFAERSQRMDNTIASTSDADPAMGDRQLLDSLSTIGVDSLKARPGWRNKLSSLISKTVRQPNAIIYGLDANAIHADQVQATRLHGDRLTPFDKFNFITASSRTNTILDANTAEEVCYDFIYGRTHDSLKIALENIIIEVNISDLLHQPSNLSSDHLPVITQIQIGT